MCGAFPVSTCQSAPTCECGLAGAISLLTSHYSYIVIEDISEFGLILPVYFCRLLLLLLSPAPAKVIIQHAIDLLKRGLILLEQLIKLARCMGSPLKKTLEASDRQLLLGVFLHNAVVVSNTPRNEWLHFTGLNQNVVGYRHAIALQPELIAVALRWSHRG